MKPSNLLNLKIKFRSELLFPIGSESRKRCESGGFIRRLIKHAERLLEEKEEKLCVEVLRTLREMMALDTEYGEKGDKLRHILLERYFGPESFKTTIGPGKITQKEIKPPIVKPPNVKMPEGIPTIASTLR